MAWQVMWTPPTYPIQPQAQGVEIAVLSPAGKPPVITNTLIAVPRAQDLASQTALGYPTA